MNVLILNHGCVAIVLLRKIAVKYGWCCCDYSCADAIVVVETSWFEFSTKTSKNLDVMFKINCG